MAYFEIVDHETWTHIDSFDTLEEAQATLEKYEEEDRKDGCYELGFYEILARC